MRGLVIAALALLTGACRSGPSSSVYEPVEQNKGSTAEAERLTKKAADLILDHPDEAEALLRRALVQDLFFGPAHNNLGVVYLNRGDLYAAANEFEWARKLMPGHPDPRLNLAITLDRAGQADEALSAYTATLEVYPGHIGAIQGLALLAVRDGRDGRDEPRLEDWLQRIALEGESEAWREWALRTRGR